MSIKNRKFESQKVLRHDMDNGSAVPRRQLKGKFIERDKEQIHRYIEDLESTILLNKGIISDLVSAEKSRATYKNIIEKLNTENGILQMKVKELIRERDIAQARVLVCEQMIAEFNGREKALEQHFDELSQEMRDQLNVKEYILQLYERRFRKTIKLLERYEAKDPQARVLLKDLVRENDEKRAVTNVLDENEELINKSKELYELIARFDQELYAMAYGNPKKENILKGSIQRRISSSETLPMSARQEIDNMEFYSKAVNNLIQSLHTSKGCIEQTIIKLKEENKLINVLNARLSKDFFETNQELKLLKEKKYRQKRGLCRNKRTDLQLHKEELCINSVENFGDVSSIISDYKNNEFFSFYGDIGY